MGSRREKLSGKRLAENAFKVAGQWVCQCFYGNVIVSSQIQIFRLPTDFGFNELQYSA